MNRQGDRHIFTSRDYDTGRIDDILSATRSLTDSISSEPALLLSTTKLSGFDDDIRNEGETRSHDEPKMLKQRKAKTLTKGRSTQKKRMPTRETKPDERILSADSSNPATSTGSRTQVIEAIEVDFYKNPTLLSRLILNQKYETAIKRLKSHPEESLIWVCAKRKPEPRRSRQLALQPPSSLQRRSVSPRRSKRPSKNATVTTYSMRRLPIHIACANLPRALDTRMKALLNELISNLIVANPEGCAQVDHTSTLPLHQALYYGAAPETVSMFLMANPGQISSKDALGRSLAELNHSGTSTEKSKQVDQILQLDHEFWSETRLEAHIRLKQGDIRWPTETQSVEVDSTEVLASSQAGAETLATMPGEEVTDNQRLELQLRSEQIVPMAWEQLEERAIALEQVLTEVNENNYVLHRKMQGMAKSRRKLMDKLDHLKKSDLMKQLQDLLKQNQKCKRKLSKMEQVLRETPPSSDDETEERDEARKRPRGNPFTKLETENMTLNNENRKLRQQYDELSKSYLTQRAKLRRLEEVVLRALKRGEPNLAAAKPLPTSGDASNVSGLTTSDSGHDVIREEGDRKRSKESRTRVQIDWDPSTMGSDNLSTIFRTAVEKEPTPVKTPHKVPAKETEFHTPVRRTRPFAASSPNAQGLPVPLPTPPTLVETTEHDLSIPALESSFVFESSTDNVAYNRSGILETEQSI